MRQGVSKSKNTGGYVVVEGFHCNEMTHIFSLNTVIKTLHYPFITSQSVNLNLLQNC